MSDTPSSANTIRLIQIKASALLAAQCAPARVKAKKRGDLIADLSETFANLREYQMKLNPAKCVFGVPAGKLLGFIVSQRGIEVNPEKIKAIQNIERPSCLKDIQRLTGSVAAVSRFVSRLATKNCHYTSYSKSRTISFGQRKQRLLWLS